MIRLEKHPDTETEFGVQASQCYSILNMQKSRGLGKINRKEEVVLRTRCRGSRAWPIPHKHNGALCAGLKIPSRRGTWVQISPPAPKKTNELLRPQTPVPRSIVRVLLLIGWWAMFINTHDTIGGTLEVDVTWLRKPAETRMRERTILRSDSLLMTISSTKTCSAEDRRSVFVF